MIAIAIDGPSGAGKSTLSRKLSKEFGFIYVDTGAMYRTLALAVLRRGINTKDEQKIDAILREINIDIRYVNGDQHMFLNEEDVSKLIRTQEVSMAASDVSAHVCVRAYLLEQQRDMARKQNVLMDGRDIGTVVLPNAKIKIFLTASAEDRAKRRYDELEAKGESANYNEVLQSIILRDENDSKRSAAPLKCADDAILIDTTGNSFEKSFEILKSTIAQKLNGEK